MSHKSQPFYTTIQEKTKLNPRSETKSTYHLELAFEQNSPSYRAGDCIGLYPENDPMLVSKTLERMRIPATSIVHHKKHGEVSLEDLLTRHANITQVTKPVIKALYEAQTSQVKKNALAELLKPENRSLFHEYAQGHELWDILDEHSEVILPKEVWGKLLPPLMPRIYSIASSPRLFPSSLHLLIAQTRYKSGGHERKGVCSNYLYERASKPLPSFIQSTKDFLPPADPSVPMIMIGPGTGVAPFRAFIQERVASGASGANWLFFGEQHESTDYYYQKEWASYIDDDKLRVTTAFSRDQNHKIYVQDRLHEAQKEVWEWIEQGAHIYICGDAAHMAPAVENTLRDIIAEVGKYGNKAADYLDAMHKEKRLVKDVY